MQKEVLIHVCGLHMAENTDTGEPLEIIVPGEYYFRDGNHYLRFEEIMDESAEPVINYIKIRDGVLEVRKKGLVSVQMVFEKGKKNMTLYTTPFGTIRLGIATLGIDFEEKEDSLSLRADYSLDMNGEHVADCFLTIRVNPKDARGLSL